MDPKLHAAAVVGDIDVLKSYKDRLLDQVTVPAKNTVLHVIAQYADSVTAIQAILSDLDSNLLESLLTWRNSEGETALYIATRNGHQGIVGQLLTASARGISTDLEGGDGVATLTQRMVRISNKRGDTPLHEAVNCKNEALVELLVKADENYEHLPNNMGKTPLYLAVEKRVSRADDSNSYLKRIFAYLVDSNVKVSPYEPSFRAILDVCKSPGISGPHGETILHAAARRKETSGFITEICERFPNTTQQHDEQGFTPLHCAAYFNNRVAAKQLLLTDESLGYITAAEDKHENMTPLHIAASKGHGGVIEVILTHCENCWDVLTSKGQNILHLAAKGQHTESISFIMKQHWVINLLNAKDNDGNTPSHLLLTSIPEQDNDSIRLLLRHPRVYVDASNDQQLTPLEVLKKADSNQFSARKVGLLKKLENRFWRVERIPWTIVDHVSGNSNKEEVIIRGQRLEEMKKRSNTHLLVATLIATVTFAAGFTVPGGYDNNGNAVLLQKKGFKAFIITDTLALISSLLAICLHFTSTLYENDKTKISHRYTAALFTLVVAIISMATTFVIGVYIVLGDSKNIKLIVYFIGVYGITYLLYHLRKVYRDKGIIADEYLLLIFLLALPIILFFIAYVLFEVGRFFWRVVKCLLCGNTTSST